jgi:hypothetical protein
VPKRKKKEQSQRCFHRLTKKWKIQSGKQRREKTRL